MTLPAQIPGAPSPEPTSYGDDLDALCDTLLPGALDAGASRVIDDARFADLAVAVGLVAPLPEATARVVSATSGAVRPAMGAALGALAALEHPLATFRALPLEARERLVERALADAVIAPLVRLVRAACFAAYLGAIENDVGLVAVGFPPFEDFADGLACSGYPRPNGDDYTYNRAPLPTAGDKLVHVLDERGDLR